jgi:LysR family transcriptional regulator, low CO2-responsive transcriptional regulator
MHGGSPWEIVCLDGPSRIAITSPEMLKLDWLEAFVVFAEHESFTRAAASLHLSQPALHVQVQKLGAALGVSLYERRGQRLALTADGRRVAAFGRELLGRTGELVDELRDGARHAPVVLSAGEGAYLYLIGEGIRAFLGQGGAPLSLITRDREGTLSAVRGGEAHVGVAALDVLPDDLDARPLGDVPQILVMPASHPLAKRRAVRLADLAGARLVVPPADRPHRALLARSLRDAGVAWEVAVEAHGWPLILRFVELGVGLAIVNACCHVPTGCVARPIPALPRQRYYVIRRRGARPEGAASRLVDALIAAGQGPPAVTSGPPRGTARRSSSSTRRGRPSSAPAS